MQEATLDRAKAKRLPPIPPPKYTYRRIRKRVHAFCFVAFTALPFFDIMRFDIPRERFYFAGYELWISEFAIIFFVLMFLMFLVIAASMFYGRMYCSYLCPQMIFSEASELVERRILRWVTRFTAGWAVLRRRLLAKVLFYLVLSGASVFLAFVFVSYFVEPRDLLRRLLSFDVATAGGISGAVTTLIVFLDFSLVRQRFCTTVCPYGYLQGMLADGNTLLVRYEDLQRDCIECKKCVRVCEMGIDIRTSPFQMECIHCGDCIDACIDVLGRLGKKGLIEYAWGERGEVIGGGETSWYRKIGIRDAKRVVVILVLLFYASGLFTALSMRHAVLVRIAPDRSVLYRMDAENRITNRFRLQIVNRGKKDTAVSIELEGLPSARLLLERNPVPASAGAEVQREFDVAVSAGGAAPGVNRFRFIATSSADRSRDSFDMTFIMPEKTR